MNYASIKACDVANGTGVRVSLFVSGCNHHCEGCFNSEAWDFNYGERFDDEKMAQIIDNLAPDYISGLSLLGGEPLDPKNQAEVLKIVKKVKAVYPNKTIWCYSGFTFEELLEMKKECVILEELLENIDILVEGRFVLSLKQLGLKFRGSSNQRILDVSKSLMAKQPIIFME